MIKEQTKDEHELRSKAADLAIEQIRTRFGEGAIMRFSETRKSNVDVIPTGCFSLDLALGVGGLPRGRVVEIYGPEASGKTTLAQHVVAECQKRGGIAAFIDAEHALDPDYARKIGVDVDSLFISQPDTGEQALEILETLVRSNAVDVVVVDSVAALTPKAEIEGEMGDSHMGLQARLMSQALRKLTAIVSKTKTIVIFINQIRMKIGVFFGNPETTPGGTALKFYSSVRIEVRRSAQIKQGDKIVGTGQGKIVKNKVAAPFRTTELILCSTKAGFDCRRSPGYGGEFRGGSQKRKFLQFWRGEAWSGSRKRESVPSGKSKGAGGDSTLCAQGGS